MKRFLIGSICNFCVGFFCVGCVKRGYYCGVGVVLGGGCLCEI